MDNWDSNSSGTSNNFAGTYDVLPADYSIQSEIINTTPLSEGHDVFSYNDPLKYSHQFEFPPLTLDVGNTHFVQPHYVDSYIRQDGTMVEGHYRDGDGNSNIDTPLQHGGGYIRSNSDGNPFNNLK